MKDKILLAIYYIIIYQLPNTKFFRHFNRLRVLYLSKVLKIMPYHSETIFEEKVYISDAKNIRIGKHCHINERVFIQGAVIGNYVMIAPDVAILNNTHSFDQINTPMIKQKLVTNQNPVIEDDVWIGRNVIILHGVRIGQGSIIGAGSVVTKDVQPYSIMGGVPARLIRSRLGGKKYE